MGEHKGSTHPPERARISNSLKALKAYFSEDPDQQICICIDQLASAWHSVVSESQDIVDLPLSKEDEIVKQLAGGWLAKNPLPPPPDAATLAEMWEVVIPELVAFRPPFEQVTIDLPRVISPIEAVIVTVIYYYSAFYRENNEFYENSKGPVRVGSV